jgi:hypothetical protein
VRRFLNSGAALVPGMILHNVPEFHLVIASEDKSQASKTIVIYPGPTRIPSKTSAADRRRPSRNLL